MKKCLQTFKAKGDNDSGFRKSLWRQMLFLLVLLLTFSPSGLIAQTIKIDGLSKSFPNEWTQSGITHVADKFNEIGQDNIFAGNEKDFFYASNWFWKLGTAKDKNDIANGAAGIFPAGSVLGPDGTPAAGGPFLVFAGDRISNSGDAQIGFWFFQDGTSPVTVNGVNTFAPEKHLPPVIGDILVLANFTGGGRDGAITVLEWVGSGGNYVDNPAFNQVAISAAVAENNGGATDVPTGWVFDDKNNKTSTSTTLYGTNEFYEGYVDLGHFGPGAACFSRFQLETRSSQELTAVLDDFVGGPLGGRPSVTVNSGTRCVNGPCVTLTATPGTPGTYNYAWTVPSGAAAPGNVASFCATTGGTYSVIITNTNGCASEPGSGTVTVNPLPTVTVNSPVKCASDPAVTVTATPGSGAGSDYNYAWTVPAGAAAPGNVQSFTTSVAGTYTVIISSKATGCTGTNSGTVTVNPNPVVSCSITGENLDGSIDITSLLHKAQMDVDLSGNVDVTAGDYTYEWTTTGSGTISDPTIKNPVYTAGISDVLNSPVSFHVKVTRKSTGCFSETNCTVNVNGAAGCPIVETAPVCNGSTNTYTASVAPAPNETWTWSANNGAIINAPNGQQSVSVTAGGTSFTLTLTKTFANPVMDPEVCNFEVTVNPCGAFCTYTQGKYGNKSPACDGDGTDGITPITYPTVTDMIKALLGVGGVPNPLVIGIPGNAVTIPSTATAAVLLNASMPGGSSARELIGNCTVDVPVAACWAAGTNPLTSYINKQGRINNVFLSQTITFALNLRINASLPGFELKAGIIAAANPVGGCGSKVPKVRSCYLDEYGKLIVVNEYTYRTIPVSIITALDGGPGGTGKHYPHTMQGLLDLANDALGNFDGVIGSENGTSLSEISGAEDAINNVFDECKIFIGWDVPACQPPVTLGRLTNNPVSESVVVAGQLKVSAYPNPFKDKVNFVIASPVSGQATLEVFNLFGQKLQTVYKGYITAGRNQVVEYIAPAITNSTLVYKLTIGDKQVTGKLISVDKQ